MKIGTLNVQDSYNELFQFQRDHLHKTYNIEVPHFEMLMFYVLCLEVKLDFGDISAQHFKNFGPI